MLQEVVINSVKVYFLLVGAALSLSPCALIIWAISAKKTGKWAWALLPMAAFVTVLLCGTVIELILAIH